jgi:DNA sulfur modification protein DndB
MLANVESIDSLSGLARARARDYETKTVSTQQTERLLTEGWSVDRSSSRSVRLRRKKTHSVYFEDRVWTLLYRMQFPFMSGADGAALTVNPKDLDSPKTQIDVVAIDGEIAIAAECKASLTASKRMQFSQELGKHSLIRDRFNAALRTQFEGKNKRQTVLVMFLENALLSENDLARAKEANIIVFREKELTYYENLVSHLGPAAKYQFLADMLPGKSVPGLAIRVPAIKCKMGKFNCYTFSISPEYLLKISYVSHRSKGRASDVDTYQRMLKKGRLTKIREYISEDGIFPTNIVINLDKNRLTFERTHQDSSDLENGVSGWLDIRPAYKSAWIIDGQHRLFAYSGHERAAKSHLAVLAFEGLVPSEQARLFIDINAKQKRAITYLTHIRTAADNDAWASVRKDIGVSITRASFNVYWGCIVLYLRRGNTFILVPLRPPRTAHTHRLVQR